MNPQQEINRLEGLLSQLLDALQVTLNSGQELSDEHQGLIAEQLNWLDNRISQLRGEEALPPQIPPLEPSIPSSNVDSFAYDNKNQKLFVRFLGKYPNRNGPIYSYDNVPSVIFDLFEKGSIPARTDGKNKWGRWWKGKVPSIGASLYTLLKNGPYPYQRLS